MTHVVTNVFRCNLCDKEESNPSRLLYWFQLTLVGDELGLLRQAAVGNRKLHFCSRKCLSKWAMLKPVGIKSAKEESDEQDE